MGYVLIVFYILIVATVGIIIINTNSPSKAIGYLLLILLLPVVGIILYFTVGVNYRKRKIYKKKLGFDKVKYPLFEEKYETFSKELLEDNKNLLGAFYPLAASRALSFLTHSSDVKLLINGEVKFPELLTDLKNACYFIHLEYYIFESGNIGNAIADILIKKAASGVKVRMIYDDFGSSGLKRPFINKLKNSGVELVPFFKIRWLVFANRINYRNHRKIVVIDGDIGYVGGINISDKYNNQDKKNKLYWRDTSVRLKGMGVAVLQYVFLTDWNFCATQNITFSAELFPYRKTILAEETKYLVQTAVSGPDSDYPNIMYAMAQAILLSKKELLITTPYFIPSATIIDALKIARLSGVEIKLLVPGVSDSKLVNAISNSYYSELLDIGIEIYKYERGFVHAKTMVCDNAVCFVGTTNLDQRSFELNFEIHEIIYNETISAQLRDAFYYDIGFSRKLNKADWENRHYITVFIERVARLLSPLI